MKTTIAVALAAASLATLSGCSFAARSPEMYRDDTKAVLDTKNVDITACYDGVLKTTPTAAGRVTVNFEVTPEEGKITNVAVDKAQTTAPDALTECVTRSIANLTLAPPDKRLGQATFVWEFAPKS